MNPILKNSIIFLASLNLLMTYLVYFRLRQPTSFALWLIKVFISAVSPAFFLFGLIIALLGLTTNSIPLIVLGSLSAVLYGIHIGKMTRPSGCAIGFEQAFGTEWASRIPLEWKAKFLPKRYVFKLPKSPDPIFDQNISFYTIPDTDRQLLCDIWQPPENVEYSGLAFIYLHGSAWTIWDKDRGTRTFFRHLAKQGHVIMDVAYRLFPETDFMGMVHDAKHAIAWMRANAEVYSVNPNRIVIGGGSAGGHIALLAAYTPENRKFMPNDLEGFDTNVQGVVSWYGPSDLEATYYHAGQHLIKPRTINDAKKDESASMPKWLQKSMGENYHRLGFDKKEEPGMLVPILGGNPAERPEAYSLFSPITHVQKGCPPTLLLNGKHDILVSAKAIRQLHARLTENDVPVVLHIVPQTDHAFDLILPKISPSAHNAIYYVERFLAIRAN